MSVMDFIGLLNAVGFLTVHTSKQVVEVCTKVRNRIGKNYPPTFWDCGQALNAENADATGFKTAAVNLNRLHNAQSKIAVVEYQVRTFHGLAKLLLIVVAVSIIAGIVLDVIPNSPKDVKTISESNILDWAFYYIPLSLLCFQLALLWKIHKAEQFVSSIKDDAISDLLGWDKD